MEVLAILTAAAGVVCLGAAATVPGGEIFSTPAAVLFAIAAGLAASAATRSAERARAALRRCKR